jgi:hypothetical protein
MHCNSSSENFCLPEKLATGPKRSRFDSVQRGAVYSLPPVQRSTDNGCGIYYCTPQCLPVSQLIITFAVHPPLHPPLKPPTPFIRSELRLLPLHMRIVSVFNPCCVTLRVRSFLNQLITLPCFIRATLSEPENSGMSLFLRLHLTRTLTSEIYLPRRSTVT